MPFAFIESVLEHPVITDEEVARISAELHKDGQLNLDDVKLLVELYSGATQYPASFRDLLFTTLEEVLLADAAIAPSEQYFLLKLLCCGRNVGQEERQFLGRLRGRLPKKNADLDSMLAAVMQA